MNRLAETVLTAAAAGLAGFGTALVNFANGGGIDAQTALAFLVFAIAFGSLLAAVRLWAPATVAFLVPLAATLAAVGFVLVYRLDRDLAALQRWWLLIGAGGACLLLYALQSGGLRILRRYRWPLAAAALAAWAAPLLPAGGPLPLQGREVNGSRLWVEWNAGLTARFQPGEIAKLLLVVFLATWLAENQTLLAGGGRRGLPQPLPAGLAAAGGAAAVGLLAFWRDAGAAALLLAIFALMLYMAADRPFYPAAGAGLFGLGAVLFYFTLPRFRMRIDGWLNPWADFAGSGYQTAQGMFALGEGSLSGAGLGLGRPDLIPAAATDYVFAALAEETGLAGTMVIIAAFGLLTAGGFGIALRARDLFRKMLAAGLSLGLGLQAFLSLAGVLRLAPATALPAPFMSYGGASLLANFLLIALLIRISHEERT